MVLPVVVQKVRGVMVNSGASVTAGVVLVVVGVVIGSDGSGVFVGGVLVVGIVGEGGGGRNRRTRKEGFVGGVSTAIKS